MTQRADAGDIVAQQSVAISDTDVALSLHQKLCAASQSLLSDVLPKIRSGQTQERAQDEAQATYVGRRTPEDGRLTGKNRRRSCITWCVPSAIRGRAHLAMWAPTNLSSGNPACVPISPRRSRAPCCLSPAGGGLW
jgi:hypothetical protein